MPPEAEVLDDRPRRVTPVALSTLAEQLGAGLDDPRATAVTGLSLASGQVRPGDLYAALPGASTHGARYADDAVARGALAVLTDAEGAALLVPPGTAGRVPVLVVERPREVVGRLAATVYGRPAERLRTIGITGTQGKTTTTYLAEAALRQAGITPAVVGTIGTRVASVPVSSALTTPEAPALQALFAVMLEHAVDACAMEVSSHALVQRRVDGVVFDVAVFLNLGRDHLDFHHDERSYFEAKALLFTPEHARRAVVNVDDTHGRLLRARTTLPVTTFSTRVSDADWWVESQRADADGTDAVVRGPHGVRETVRVPMPGGFNVSNALAVVAALTSIGLDPVAVCRGIGRSAGVPGRMQSVDEGQDFRVVVDYAHKPDALQAVLSGLRPVTAGRLLVVLGAGGDRDTGKRPLMGAVAAELADVVVVTDDNPRSEDPAAIRRAVVRGARDAGTATEVREVGDRSEAIGWAVDHARTGDCVVVAGKGHEQGQVVAGEVHPFDDTAAATAHLRRRLAAEEPS